MLKARFKIEEVGADYITIRDIGPWGKHPTVTNDAEAVVEHLFQRNLIGSGQRLLYIDSNGDKDEIRISDGKFAGFKPFKTT